MLWFLIVGVIAGWLAGNIMKGGGFGLIGDLVVGVVGAFIGGVKDKKKFVVSVYLFFQHDENGRY